MLILAVISFVVWPAILFMFALYVIGRMSRKYADTYQKQLIRVFQNAFEGGWNNAHGRESAYAEGYAWAFGDIREKNMPSNEPLRKDTHG